MSRQRYKATFDGTRFEGKAEMEKVRAATVTFEVQGPQSACNIGPGPRGETVEDFGFSGLPRELTRQELDRAARIAAHAFRFTVTRVISVVPESDT